MKELKKLSLKEEVDREAQEIEKEVESREDLDDIKVSDDMETSLFNKIQEYEYDKRIKKVMHRSKKKRRLFLALAAVLILVCGSVITSTGSKSYWKVLWDRVMGEDNLSVVNVEDMDSQETEDLDEVQIYKEITDKLGIVPLGLTYLPENMFLTEYEIDETQNKAVLLYKHNGQNIQYSMYMNDTDSSLGQIEIDNIIDEYDIKLENGIIFHVREYLLEESERTRFVAEAEYRDAQYQLIGVIEKEEFEKIIKNIILM